MEQNPFKRFADVFARAEKQVMKDANAMVLSTVDSAHRPHSRVVLLKGFDERGFVFYTNLQSQKGQQLLAHPYASLNFHWRELDEQIRIEGTVEGVTDAEADAYFASRPRMSQLGAWASQQSRPLASREELEQRLAQFEKDFDGQPVPRPRHWSGLRVVPSRFEFWEGKPSRLHDRWTYIRQGQGWKIDRLYP